jgi:hypothetical protein
MDPSVSTNTETLPRPLTQREADVLRFILRPDDPRLVPLREQVEWAMVVDVCRCGCRSFDMTVDRASGRPAEGLGRIAVEVTRLSGTGVYWLGLWLDDGWLLGVEADWIPDMRGNELPSLAELEAARGAKWEVDPLSTPERMAWSRLLRRYPAPHRPPRSAVALLRLRLFLLRRLGLLH